jgi:hypothetical protein
MLHDLYIGEERDPRHDDQFDMNLTTGNLMVRVAEAIPRRVAAPAPPRCTCSAC